MFFTSWMVGLAALVFYALIPVIGALIVRTNWHSFRVRLAQTQVLPPLDSFSLIQKVHSVGNLYKVFAEIDAVGEHDCLWIRSNNKTLTVDMHNVPVYVFTGNSEDGTGLPQDEEDSVDKVRWSAVPSLVQGTRIFIAGCMEMRKGIPTMVTNPESPMLVILHNLGDDELLPRVIAAGRHKNEYWNPLTQISMALGIMVISGLITTILANPSISLVLALSLTIALSPVLPILPPGVFLFFLYRRFWRRAYYFRSKRDVSRLHGNSLAVGWSRLATVSLLVSAGCFLLALTINAWIVFWLLRITL